MSNRVNPIIIYGAKIIFKNFAGREGRFNKEGERGFSVIIDDDELAQQLSEDGWNIKILPPRNEDEVARHKLDVAVFFKIRPPVVYMLSHGRKIRIDEDSIGNLDYADIVNADLTINPRIWINDSGNERIKAYLKSLYITIEEDELADKYADYE